MRRGMTVGMRRGMTAGMRRGMTAGMTFAFGPHTGGEPGVAKLTPNFSDNGLRSFEDVCMFTIKL